MTGPESVRVEILRLPDGEGLPLPEYMTEHAAGMDICAAEEVTIDPGRRELVSAGFSIALPPGYEAQIRPRSGLAARHGVTVLNAPGTIDADYRGPVKVILINLGQDRFEVHRGDRIAQMVVAPVAQVEWVEADELSTSERGAGGFGHTGT